MKINRKFVTISIIALVVVVVTGIFIKQRSKFPLETLPKIQISQDEADLELEGSIFTLSNSKGKENVWFAYEDNQALLKALDSGEHTIEIADGDIAYIIIIDEQHLSNFNIKRVKSDKFALNDDKSINYDAAEDIKLTSRIEIEKDYVYILRSKEKLDKFTSKYKTIKTTYLFNVK